MRFFCTFGRGVPSAFAWALFCILLVNASHALAAHYTLCIPIHPRSLPDGSQFPNTCTYRHQIYSLREAFTDRLVTSRVRGLSPQDASQARGNVENLRITSYRGHISRLSLRGINHQGNESYHPRVDIIIRNSDFGIIGFITGETGERVFYRLQGAPERNATGRPTWNNAQHDYTRQRPNPRVELDSEEYTIIQDAPPILLPISYDPEDLAYWSGYSYEAEREVEYRPGDTPRTGMIQRDGHSYYIPLTVSRHHVSEAFQILADFEFLVDQHRPVSRVQAAEQRTRYREDLEDVAWALQQIGLVYLEALRFQFIEDAIAGSPHRTLSANDIQNTNTELSAFDHGERWSPARDWYLTQIISRWGEISFMGSQGLSLALRRMTPASLLLRERGDSQRALGITSAPYDVGSDISWSRLVAVVQRAQWVRGRQANMIQSCPIERNLSSTLLRSTSLRKRRSVTFHQTTHVSQTTQAPRIATAPRTVPESMTTTPTPPPTTVPPPRQIAEDPELFNDCQSVSWQVTDPVTLFGSTYLSRDQITRLVADFMTDTDLSTKYFDSEWWRTLGLVLQEQEDNS